MSDGNFSFLVDGKTLNVSNLADLPSLDSISSAGSFRVLAFEPVIAKICNRYGCRADRTKIDNMINTMKNLIAKEK
jgi:hypothetical protein